MRSTKFYCLAEVLCALTILAVIVASFQAILIGMSKTENNILLKNRAILALDNALEIMAATPSFALTEKNVETILNSEWNRQGLDGNGKITLVRKTDGGKTVARLLDKRKHVIVEIALPAGGSLNQ
jgi:type II secretory pathway component PulJ